MSRAKTSSAPRAPKTVTFETVKQMALALPGVEEGTSYGTPALKVRGKLLARLREDGESLVLKVDPEARDVLVQSDPQTFFVTDHYVGYPLVLVKLASARIEDLQRLFEEAWRESAPKRLLAEHDSRG